MYKAIFILITLFSNLFIESYGQNTFQKTIGGNGYDFINSALQLNDGYILVGETDSYGEGNRDGYIIRLNTKGDIIWTKVMGGIYEEGFNKIATTLDGGFIITGHSGGALSLLKTDSNGNSMWEETFGGWLSEEGYDVKQTKDNGFIISGSTQSYGPLNSGLVTANVYVIKTNINGDTLWTGAFGETKGEGTFGVFVEETESGDYVLASSSISFSSRVAGYMIKVNNDGDTLWTKIIVSAGYIRGFEQTSDKGFILIGWDWLDGPIGMRDIILTKTDSEGNVLWSKMYGGLSVEYGIDVIQTKDNGYILVAETESFGNGAVDPNGKNFNIHLIKVDSIGNIMWSKTYGDAAFSGPRSIIQTSDNGYLISGYTYPINTGGADIYLIKTDSLGNAGCNQTNPNSLSKIFFTSSSRVPTRVAAGGEINDVTSVINYGGEVTNLCDVSVPVPLSYNFNFGLYPNPNNGSMTLNYLLSKGDKGEVQLYGFTGTLLKSYSLSETTNRLLINEELPNGIYLFKVLVNGEQVASEKLIVIK